MELQQEESIFGMKRTRRIEVVKSKDVIKKKNGIATTAAILKSPVADLIGLGMTRSTGSSKGLKIDPVSFSKYTTGTLALGFVLYIRDDYVAISLPGGSVGRVYYPEISDAIHTLVGQSSKDAKKAASVLPAMRSLVSVMQPVRCYVLALTEKSDTQRKTLVLSMRSLLVNRGLAIKHMIPGFPISGCIVSKEDHGYVLSAGMSGVTFFLPFKAAPVALETSERRIDEVSAVATGSDLTIGQPIECIVDSANETARSVSVRAQRKAVSEGMTKGNLLPFNALSPGMKFIVTIDKVAQVCLLERNSHSYKSFLLSSSD